MADLASLLQKIQVEATRFRTAVSESLAQDLGGNINGILDILTPVGSIVHSMLDQTTFQGLTSTKWVLADGRSVAGSAYESITGNSTIPDLRGIFLRGKNNSRSSGGNTGGDLALGTSQTDFLKSHTHSVPGFLYTASGAGQLATTGANGSQHTDANVLVTGATGVSETAPRSVTVNIFIRIN